MKVLALLALVLVGCGRQEPESALSQGIRENEAACIIIDGHIPSFRRPITDEDRAAVQGLTDADCADLSNL